MAEAYLLHFDAPFKHARHYLGITENLGKRLKRHEAGDGAVLLRHVKAAGIHWRLVREWDIPEGYTPREFEIKLKKRGGASRLCPLCREAVKRERKQSERS